MAKREKRLDALGVVMAIADKDAFPIPYAPVLAWKEPERRVVFKAFWERLGKLARRLSQLWENIELVELS